jgi:hypothetical protein
MKERPILFSGPMVRTILDDTKTQTRRVVKPQAAVLTDEMARALGVQPPAAENQPVIPCPYGIPGDRLWVRETWQAIHVSIDPETGYGDDVQYAAKIPASNESGWWSIAYAATDPSARDCIGDRGFPWRPSIFQPRWASRILLEITDVRVQRLHQISEQDARAEGADKSLTREEMMDRAAGWPRLPSHRSGFRNLWDTINGSTKPERDDNGNVIAARDFSWSANPWVWAITFRRVH